MKKLLREQAEEHWWYRLIKAGYVIAMIFVALSLAAFLYYTWPQVDFYSSHYQMRCDGESKLVFGNLEGKDVNYDYGKSYDEQTFAFDDNRGILDMLTKITCEQGTLLTDDQRDTYLIDGINQDSTYDKYHDMATNYTIFADKKVYDPIFETWWEELAGALFVLALLKYGVPRIFDYVVFGKREVGVEVV